MTIARFLARELNLAGKTRCEEACVDMVVDCVVDLFAAFVKLAFEKDETKKAELTEKMQKETVPTAMCNLVAIFFSTPLQHHGEEYFGSNKKLLALVKRVMDCPNIKAWVEKRPKTDL